MITRANRPRALFARLIIGALGGTASVAWMQCSEIRGIICRNTIRLQQIAKLLDRETRVPDNTTEGESVDRIVARNSDHARAACHDDVLALTNDRETCLFKSVHSFEMIDAGYLRQDYTTTSTSRTGSPRN